MRFLVLIATTIISSAQAQSAVAADPPWYSKQATWQDSMLASLEALEQQPLKDAFDPFESEILRGGQTPQQLNISVVGAAELYLFVTGDPDVKWGVADWADARLIGHDGKATPLSALKRMKFLLGRHELDLTLRSGLYQKMRLAGREFQRGLHVQANSVVQVPLDGNYARFEVSIGIDDWAGTNGHARFSVTGTRTAARKRLWEFLARDFPENTPRQEMRWEMEDRIWEDEWTVDDWPGLAARYARACRRVPPLAAEVRRFAASVKSNSDCEKVRRLYFRSRELDAARIAARDFNFPALRLAIEDLSQSESYPKPFAARLDALETARRAVQSKGEPEKLEDFERRAQWQAELETFKREALLANPLLNFDRLLAIKRKPIGDPRRSQWEDRGLGEFIGLPKQSSWGNATMTKVDNWENEIAVLSPATPEGQWTTLFKPDDRKLVSDVDLHFDADRLLFSMPDKRNRWQIYELPLKPGAPESRFAGPLRQLTPGDQPEVHCYDACYLPNGKIDFLSTAVLQGVPCNAGVIVGMMYQIDANGGNIRQICFEQDHDYNPSVLNDGRVVYLRWDYTDTPHVWNRILMSMNPDGTSQMAYYGGNSYWPNAVFFPRAIPGHPTKLAGIVTGHHEGRVGELVIFDPAKGTHETDGVVQRIPGYGRKVEPRIEDKLTEHSWPKFAHPWPLGEKYFLVACKPEPHSLWGIYLVDIFDNMTLLKEEEGNVLLEPIPWRKRSTPPVIPDRVQPARQDALVYMEDVYAGPGLKGIPRGSVKNLRLFTYHFGYQTLAGIDHRVGADGPWETKRVLGTVPVESDGSAWFRIPAKTPISVQPLDVEGRALALMRSWMTAMPGENLSCVGCHEQSHEIPPVRHAMALRRQPSEIQSWRGPVRGFSFAREVQPVLDKYCVGCHNPDYARSHKAQDLLESRSSRRQEAHTSKSESDQRLVTSAATAQEIKARTLLGNSLPNLRGDQGAYVVYEHGKIDGQVIRGAAKENLLGKYSAVFEPSYAVLRQYVRVGGLESDLHLLPAKEFHADTSELIQMLRKGHHNVQLDAEAWDRLITWIDLNAPCHGTWREVTRLPGNQRDRRLALRKLYGGVEEDGEEILETKSEPAAPLMPEPRTQPKHELVTAAGWPFDEREAKERQARQGPSKRTIDLGDGVTLSLVRIPAGAFVMGDSSGEADEQPPSSVSVEQPFWMAIHEVTNEQFARFDRSHDSRFEHRSSWIFSEEYLGWPLNRPRQPVVRVSWQEALAFCRWLSDRIGENVTLPTEAQWEYACRAGTATPLSYGGPDTDFSPFANLGDANLRKLANEGWRPKAPDLVPRDDRFDDGALVTVEVGRYRSNAWGLFDMHGNAAEWTRTVYRPYPYRTDDGRDAISNEGPKVVRGGSWRDRPLRCRSSFRLSYPPYQKVFNVGFRVVIEPRPKTLATAEK